MNVHKDTSPVHFTFNGSNEVRLNAVPWTLHYVRTQPRTQNSVARHFVTYPDHVHTRSIIARWHNCITFNVICYITDNKRYRLYLKTKRCLRDFSKPSAYACARGMAVNRRSEFNPSTMHPLLETTHRKRPHKTSGAHKTIPLHALNGGACWNWQRTGIASENFISTLVAITIVYIPWCWVITYGNFYVFYIIHFYMTPYHPHQAITAQIPMSQTLGDKFHHYIPVTIRQPTTSHSTLADL